MTILRRPRDGHFVLDGVSWKSYERISRSFDERKVRINYDRGRLELMTLSPEHERFKKLLGLLVEILLLELGWEWASYGSMTFKRPNQDRGLEPDDCFWIQSERLVRGKDRIDLRKDPPPDLVLEIEVSHGAVNRLAIFGVLGVPEVWRFNGKSIRVHLLGANGSYTESPTSRVFPFLPLAQLVRFLNRRKTAGTNSVVREFQKWVREQIARNWK
jgi:Uma2 family endonuclease